MSRKKGEITTRTYCITIPVKEAENMEVAVKEDRRTVSNYITVAVSEKIERDKKKEK